MSEIENYIITFQACLKLAETFWPIGIIMLAWFLSERRFKTGSSYMQTKTK